MRVFVTGATGLLGNTIARQLYQQGHAVSVLVRNGFDPAVFEDLELQFVEADLSVVPQGEWPKGEWNADDSPKQDATCEPCDESAESCESDSRDPIDRAIEASDAVIHCAGLIHLGWTRLEQSLSVNREGTRRVAESCLRHGKKLVHIGTVDAVAVGTRDQPADELTPLENAGGQIPSVYPVSKRAGVDVVLEGVNQGLQAVILHPGFMLGPWDWKPSSGQMLIELSKGGRFIAPSGGCSVCDSRDVARASIRAINFNGPSGREFIVAGENWTYKKLWTEMARRFGRLPPVMAAGPGQRFIGGLFGDLFTKLTGKEPLLNSASIAMSSQFHWYRSDRAKDELGYRTRDPHESLDDAVTWIRERFLNRDRD